MRYHSAGRRVNLSYISCLDVSNNYFNNGVMKKLQSWSWMSMKNTLFFHLYREKSLSCGKNVRATDSRHGWVLFYSARSPNTRQQFRRESEYVGIGSIYSRVPHLTSSIPWPAWNLSSSSVRRWEYLL